MTVNSSFGLAVQRMATTDAVLALSQIASLRSKDRTFRVAYVLDLFDSLRVPRPSDVSREVRRLSEKRPALLRRGGNGSGDWTVTPEGQHHVTSVLGDFDYTAIEFELSSTQGAVFAHGEYSTLPPTLAPVAWIPGIKSFLERFPFERNIFLMTRFPKSEADEPLASMVCVLKRVVEENGLFLHIASDQQIVDDLWGNVGAHMWACRFGIGILEARSPEALQGTADLIRGPGVQRHRSSSGGLNSNVLIELGSMLTIGRRCMIVKDIDSPTPPTDLTSHIYKSVDLSDLDLVASETRAWIENDLRIT